MLNQPLFKPFFITTVVIGVLHNVAIVLYWYWLYWWTDVVMHILGGLFVGLGILWFVFFSEWAFVSKITKSFSLILVIMVVAIIAVGWEVFEFSLGIFEFEEQFPDTTHDLFAGLGGGLIAYLYLISAHKELLWKKEQNQS